MKNKSLIIFHILIFRLVIIHFELEVFFSKTRKRYNAVWKSFAIFLKCRDTWQQITTRITNIGHESVVHKIVTKNARPRHKTVGFGEIAITQKTIPSNHQIILANIYVHPELSYNDLEMLIISQLKKFSKYSETFELEYNSEIPLVLMGDFNTIDENLKLLHTYYQTFFKFELINYLDKPIT